jgi:NTE family protein
MSEVRKGNKREKIGLVLGGGGARGLAHIGVLRVLEREAIPIDLIAGTSMGGLVGALYSAGIPIDDLDHEVNKLSSLTEQLRLLDVSVSAAGLSVRGRRIYNYMADLLGEELTFSDLRIPLAMVAVDLNSGRDIVLQGGLVIDAVRASISIPGIFMPMELAEYRLVDGGVLDNVPVDVAVAMGATKTIAIDVLPSFSRDNQFNQVIEPPAQIPFAPQYLNETYHVLMIMIAALTESRLRQNPPDLLIRPELPANVTLLIGFHQSAKIIEAGEAAAEVALPAIKELLNRS